MILIDPNKRCNSAKVNHSAAFHKGNIGFYFEDCLYKYHASAPKIKLGNQAADRIKISFQCEYRSKPTDQNIKHTN